MHFNTVHQLSEVVVTDRLPQVIEKKDTVIYNVSEFTNGQEWKLREILTKLPGIEITSDNQVLYKGERVEEVLVEGQTFFTGDAALAVRYIPADAVDKVQVLERYNEVASLRGSGINDKLALNIQLKPERKKLLFGEVLAGTNAQARHTLHANLFRYMPRTSINYIGDFNTTEQAALTNAEMIRLVGFRLNGYAPRGSVVAGAIEELAELMTQNWVAARRSMFNITQLRQKLPKDATLDAIVMWVDKDERAGMRATTDYLSALAREHILQTTANRAGRLMAKTTLATDNNKPNRIAYEFHYTQRTQERNAEAEVLFNEQDSRSVEQWDDRDAMMRHELTAILKLDDRWQSILQTHLRHGSSQSDADWDVAGGWTPTFYASDVDTFALAQSLSHRTLEHSLLWRVNRTLGPGSRAYLFVQRSGRTDEADADASFATFGGAYRSLNPLGVGYVQLLEANEWATGGRLLLKKRDIELQLGMDYLDLNWSDTGGAGRRMREARPAPVLEVSTLLRGVGKVRLSYGYDVIAPRQTQLFNGLEIRHFNRLRQGNPDLAASRANNATLHFSKSNLLKGRTLSANATYLYTVNPLLPDYIPLQNVLLEGFVNSINAREDFIATLSTQWYRKGVRVASRARFSYIRFWQEQLGGEPLVLRQRSLLHIFTLAKEWERIEADITNKLSFGHLPTSGAARDWFLDNRLSLSFQQRFGQQWKADFTAEFNYVDAVTIRSGNTNLSCSLRYAIPSGRYALLVRVHNLLNQRLVPENQTTAFLNRNVLYATIPRFIIGSVTRVF